MHEGEAVIAVRLPCILLLRQSWESTMLLFTVLPSLSADLELSRLPQAFFRPPPPPTHCRISHSTNNIFFFLKIPSLYAHLNFTFVSHHLFVKMGCMSSSVSWILRRLRRLAQNPNNDAEKTAASLEKDPSKCIKLHAILEVSDAEEMRRFLKDVFDETGMVITRLTSECFDIALSGSEGGGTSMRFSTRDPNNLPRMLQIMDDVESIGLRICLEVGDLETIRARLSRRSCLYQILGKSVAIKFYLEYVVQQTYLPLIYHASYPHI